jgi:hypothetical protein
MVSLPRNKGSDPTYPSRVTEACESSTSKSCFSAVYVIQEAESFPGAFVDFSGLPLSIQEAQTADEAARFMNTKKREMYNVVAVQLRRHALTALAALARDSNLLRPEAFLRRTDKDRQVRRLAYADPLLYAAERAAMPSTCGIVIVWQRCHTDQSFGV